MLCFARIYLLQLDITLPKSAPRLTGICFVDIEVFNFDNTSSAASLKNISFLENSELGFHRGLDLLLATPDILLNCDVVIVEIRNFARVSLVKHLRVCSPLIVQYTGELILSQIFIYFFINCEPSLIRSLNLTLKPCNLKLTFNSNANLNS